MSVELTRRVDAPTLGSAHAVCALCRATEQWVVCVLSPYCCSCRLEGPELVVQTYLSAEGGGVNVL